MKWEEVKNLYPEQWVKLNVQASHIEASKKIIDDMEVLRALSSDEEAGDELGKCKENEAIFHTYHEKISYKMTRLFGFRRRAM
jgi:hypothetical protein